MRGGIAVVVLLAASATSAPASAEPEKPAEKCVAAADRGQLLRDEGKLRASRAELVVCGAEACPTVVRRECVRWLEDVEARIPTVVVAPRDGHGKDLAGARLVLDGEPVDPSRTGRAIPLDPGTHTVTAEMPGHEAVRETFVLRERERERVVPVVLRAPGEVVRTEKRVPALSWVLGGVAVAGGVGFGVFWAKGMDQVGDLRATCSPYCTQEQIDEVRPSLTIARVSGAIGIGAGVAAIAVYLLSSPKPVRTGAALTPNGVAVSF